MSEDEGQARGLERTGSADDMTTSDTQPLIPEMSLHRRLASVSKQQMRPTMKVARAFILWPLVIYSLIQINAYLIANNHHRNSSCSSAHLQQAGSPYSSESRVQSSANLYCRTSSCSSSTLMTMKSSTQTNDAASSLYSSISKAYLSLLNHLNHHQDSSSSSGRTLFGGKVLFAEALSIQFQAHQDGGIILLNSTNFNSELIQYKHPFPHIKLIEYCVLYSKYCKDFKKIYSELAREIHPWRNVIRPSAIDLSAPENSPIARSWDVDTIPSLRIHPPPDPLRARILSEQLDLWSKTMTPSDLQRSTYQQYTDSGLMVESLKVTQYMNNVQLLKSDLLNYLQNFVLNRPSELPNSWPNLKSVTEESLLELRLNHPRQELFLIIDGSISTSAKDQSSSTEPSLAFSIMLELSSTSAWKAIRYVRASENKALIEDVIEQQKKASEQRANQYTAQVDLLNNLLSSQPTEGNNVLLVYLDDSHSPARTGGPSVAFPFMTIKSVADLVTMEKAASGAEHENYNSRARRSADQDYKNLSNQRKVELVANFVKQTYTETSVDREFTEALSSFEETGRLDDSSKYLSQLEDDSRRVQQPRLSKTNYDNQVSDQAMTNDSSLLAKIHDLLKRNEASVSKPKLSSKSDVCDYDDKLKAIRYMLFTEIPRSSTIEKSFVDQQGSLNTLVNLVTVIKAYFPFADSPSIQFIDGVLSYLTKQQSRLSSIKPEDLKSSGFDTRLFKQELKRLESENKRLPEIKDWKHCTGYPCALWRLFHTLTAFEYKKLNQIRQPTSRLPTTGLRQPDNNLSPSVEAITMKSTDSLSPPSPVERLVSPPSTTTILSLTIATPNTSQTSDESRANNNKPLTEADLPPPVLLVMRDYITTFFSCSECATKFRSESSDLTLERIRQQEPAEFSILWLWETHNRVNKRLSVDLETNPPERPKVWFPSYDQCSSCYKKAPSFLKDTTVDSVTIFHESIEWNMQEILNFLVQDYTKQPMDSQINLFGNQVLYGFKYIFVTCVCFLILIVVLRCTTYYMEMQRRRKTTLLYGNGTRYSLELQ